MYVYPHIPSLSHVPPTLLIPPLQVVTKHQADLPVPCSCFPLAIYFTFGSVYVHATLSLHPSFPFPLPVSSKSTLYVCVFIPVLPLGSSEPFFFFFRFHIYVLAYSICFILSDLLHSVQQTLGPSTSLQIAQFRYFLWLSNIPLYICATSSSSILSQ